MGFAQLERQKICKVSALDAGDPGRVGGRRCRPRVANVRPSRLQSRLTRLSRCVTSNTGSPMSALPASATLTELGAATTPAARSGPTARSWPAERAAPLGVGRAGPRPIAPATSAGSNPWQTSSAWRRTTPANASGRRAMGKRCIDAVARLTMHHPHCARGPRLPTTKSTSDRRSPRKSSTHSTLAGHPRRSWSLALRPATAADQVRRG